MSAAPEMQDFIPGSLVKLRGRSWIVEECIKHEQGILSLKPLGGSDSESTWVYLPMEQEKPLLDQFPLPNPALAGVSSSGFLLYDCLRLSMRAGAGPFRSFSSLSFTPKPYQLVPLMMALKQDLAVRLLIADDVGVGKTIEAGLIIKELLDRGEIASFAIVCPPHLCEQWQQELFEKFSLSTTLLTSSTIHTVERGLPPGHSLFEEHPYTVISLDFIKSERRSSEFVRVCPEFVVIEEADTCVGGGTNRQQRFKLLSQLAEESARHIVLLTATPHHGDDEAFCRLLSLLRLDFLQLQHSARDAKNSLWNELSDYFIQRRRADIEEWQQGSCFPQKERAKASYAMTSAWAKFFAMLTAYAKEYVMSAGAANSARRRFCGFAALQLLRGASSSPAAIIQALSRKLHQQNSAVLLEESDNEDAVSSEREWLHDQELSRDDKTTLQNLIQAAEKLTGVEADPKLALLITQVKKLLTQGFKPVIFCHFIPTAHYLADELRKAFSSAEVVAITGLLSGEERKATIEKLEGLKSNYILVATDCISTGINLHRAFNAVIHYDLVWNPTRHEQREGRVDRYGQPSPLVRTLLLFGSDNSIDLHVLDVITRKMKAIQQKLGVRVAMAADEEDFEELLVNQLILGKNPIGDQQLSLFANVSMESLPDWEDVRNSLRRSQTKFAQKTLKQVEVDKELQKSIEKMGDAGTVERFVCMMASRLGVPLHRVDDGKTHRWSIQELPIALRRRLIQNGIEAEQTLLLSFSDCPGVGVKYLHRTDPMIKALCDELLNSATREEQNSIARSCALFCDIVKERTIVCLLRVRYSITAPKGHFNSNYLSSEECLVIEWHASQEPRLLTCSEAENYFTCEPVKNMSAPMRTHQIEKALSNIAQLNSAFHQIIEARAQELADDHLRVREASKIKGQKKVNVIPMPFYDMVAVYVFLPKPII